MKRQRRHRILYPFLLKYFILLNNKIFFQYEVYKDIYVFYNFVFFFKNYIFSLKIIVLMCIYLIKESVNLSKQ